MSMEDEVMAAPVPVRVKGVYIAESEGSAPVPVVLLEDELGRIVPIFVGLSEAVSIHHAISGELSPRPMTHDLFISVLECLSATSPMCSSMIWMQASTTLVSPSRARANRAR